MCNASFRESACRRSATHWRSGIHFTWGLHPRLSRPVAPMWESVSRGVWFSLGFLFASQAPIRSWSMRRARPCNLFASQTAVDKGEDRISLRDGVHPATVRSRSSGFLVTDGNLYAFS